MKKPATRPATTRRPPSMSEVARLAGVSAQTVSRALADHPHVAAGTRERVLQVVKETGYRRNSTARALVTGQSRLLGVVTFETDFYAGSSILLAIRSAARAAGYFVTTSSTGSVDVDAVKGAANRLLEQGVDALIMAVPVKDAHELERDLGSVPIVIVGAASAASDEGLGTDQHEIGRKITRHLLDLGHETVWHVAGPDAWGDAAGRSQGWRDELEESNREVPPILFGDWTPESGYRNGLLLGRVKEATAVYVSSDEMAFGVIAGLNEMGRKVPEDISVVGTDDIALARYASPPLTTWHQPFDEIGHQAVALIIERLRDPSGTHDATEAMLGELVVRGSTAAPTH